MLIDSGYGKAVLQLSAESCVLGRLLTLKDLSYDIACKRFGAPEQFVLDAKCASDKKNAEGESEIVFTSVLFAVVALGIIALAAVTVMIGAGSIKYLFLSATMQSSGGFAFFLSILGLVCTAILAVITYWCSKVSIQGICKARLTQKIKKFSLSNR